MRIVKQSLALVVLGSLLVIASAAAQQGGTGSFKWYVGGHGGYLVGAVLPGATDHHDQRRRLVRGAG